MSKEIKLKGLPKIKVPKVPKMKKPKNNTPKCPECNKNKDVTDDHHECPSCDCGDIYFCVNCFCQFNKNGEIF